jgi:hypothetical protein
MTGKTMGVFNREDVRMKRALLLLLMPQLGLVPTPQQ